MTKKAASGLVPLYHFWQPRYWWMWLLIALVRLLTLLPFRLQMWFGRAMGRSGHFFIRGRRQIAAANIRICFPELDEDEQRELVKKHFESLGMGVFDLAMSWWASDRRIAKLVSLSGVEHIDSARAGGRGVVVLSGHFSGIEFTGRRVIKSVPDICALYRPTKNKLANEFLRRGRMRASADIVPKDDMRRMIRLLRNGGSIWYASDQKYNRKYHEIVPFFGEPAMTNAALTQIARISKAAVVPYISRRRADYSGYDAQFLPPLENFPTEDPAVDAARVSALLEELIRIAPEQYLWIHRRFSGRPEGFTDPYSQPAT